MATPPKREGRHLLPDLFDWPDLPGLLTWPPPLGGQRGIRVEEYVEDGRFIVRAELPGLDPDKDVSVDIAHGALSIHAERHQHGENRRSEFHYGSFTRTLTLPQGADESKVTARYDAGILEITVPVETRTPESRSVPIEHAT